MLEFQLFRIKVFPSQQRNLFGTDMTRPEILRRVISSHPALPFRTRMTWHIGNVSEIDESGLYFRIGRTSKSTLEVYSEEEGNFLDLEFDMAPYTHGLLDVELELCAIAKKTKLSHTTAGIARQLVRLLNESPEARALGATFEIDDVKDPEDFISQLRAAYSISKFWVTLSRPNAFDANQDFVKPVQNVIEQSDGETGKVEIKGSDLKSEPLELITRSVAATGDDAGALLKVTAESKNAKKQLKGSSVTISQEDVSHPEEKRTLLDRMRRAYREIWGSQEGDGN